MGMLMRFRNYRERRAYERSVKIREKYSPYGVMYGKIVAYQRALHPVRVNGRNGGITRTDPEITTSHADGRYNVSAGIGSAFGSLDEMKREARLAFMTHPCATEADFERCWPSIRDEIFKIHTLRKLNNFSLDS